MWVYQDAYGFSTERLMVITIELWLGTVFVLIAVAGARMSSSWLPRAVLVAGVVALLGLAALNPERLIADRNIDRSSARANSMRPICRCPPISIPPCTACPSRCARARTGESPAGTPWYLFNLSGSRADRIYTSARPEICVPYWPGY